MGNATSIMGSISSASSSEARCQWALKSHAGSCLGREVLAETASSQLAAHPSMRKIKGSCKAAGFLGLCLSLKKLPYVLKCRANWYIDCYTWLPNNVPHPCWSRKCYCSIWYPWQLFPICFDLQSSLCSTPSLQKKKGLTWSHRRKVWGQGLLQILAPSGSPHLIRAKLSQ